MNPRTRRAVGAITVMGGAVLLRPGTRGNRCVRHRAEVTGRHLRHLCGKLRGLNYRLRRRHPDADVSGLVLADRIRSSLGPLEKRLDLPRILVMVEEHTALLHGAVGSESEADEIERAVEAVPGVHGVESYLHIGLGQGDTRPSAGRAVEQPSEAYRRLVAAATSCGIDPGAAPSVVRAILATFAERIPDDEREEVAVHLPTDVRGMFAPPRRSRGPSRLRTMSELVARIAATTTALPAERAVATTRAVVQELHALVPEEGADVAAILPAELRDLWDGATPADR
jgi:uncharacterized protein (DUF2267 family)